MNTIESRSDVDAVKAEREACAKIADAIVVANCDKDGPVAEAWVECADRIRREIRTRT